MKIGLIVEGANDGADKKVYEYWVRKFDPKAQVITVALGDKKTLINKCGKTALGLIEIDHCDRIVIIWDLHPAWRGEGVCRKEDRARILEVLKNEGLTSPPVYLVCVEKELETWLLADKRALEEIAPKAVDRIKDYKKPEHRPDPKGYLEEIFRPYNSQVHVPKIIAAWEKFNGVERRLKRCPSFVRFALKTIDKNL